MDYVRRIFGYGEKAAEGKTTVKPPSPEPVDEKARIAFEQDEAAGGHRVPLDVKMRRGLEAAEEETRGVREKIQEETGGVTDKVQGFLSSASRRLSESASVLGETLGNLTHKGASQPPGGLYGPSTQEETTETKPISSVMQEVEDKVKGELGHVEKTASKMGQKLEKSAQETTHRIEEDIKGEQKPPSITQDIGEVAKEVGDAIRKKLDDTRKPDTLFKVHAPENYHPEIIRAKNEPDNTPQ